MIYITGDTHRDVDWSKLSAKQFPEGNKLTKNDYIIICGDFGVIWSGMPKDRYFIDWYENKPWTTLFIDGNHENHQLLNSYPVEEWNGGKIHRISNSIIHLMRGQVFQIDGYSFFTMGGATSVDKMYRKEGLTWWKEEMPSYDEMQTAIENLDKCQWNVDYILTHSLPSDIVQYYGFSTDSLTSFFTHLEFDFHLEFKTWFCGHYHKDKQFDSKHIMVYDTIYKIPDLSICESP